MRLRRLVASNRDAILRLARKHGVSSIRLFGSVARGDAEEGSDVDFLVTFAPGSRVMARLDLKEDIEHLLGVPVDLSVEAALHRVIKEDVLREAVPV
jgi:predicted nucleotidyltransferase